ncbi:MAG: hypothetical protein HN535_05550, partial [Flavobacteriales bacterium]|nr:hypothetical protein [Flavobacteriales bacterium]
MKRKLLLWAILLGGMTSYGQDFSKNSLFVGLGLGMSENSEINGVGTNWTIGYQNDIRNTRFKLVRSIRFGTYTDILIQDIPQTHFNSINLNVNLNFDFFNVRGFSVFIGSGLTGNFNFGLIGSGGWYERLSSNHFRDFNLAINGLSGFRLNPSKKRIGYELLLFPVSFGL